jgi:phosphotriesterase-related protein
VLDTGVYIGLDRYGWNLFLPVDQRNTTTLALLERGYAERMFLSQDWVVALDWVPQELVPGFIEQGMVEADMSMTLIFERIIPALKEGGMTDDQLETMLVANPARWLGG